MFTERRCSRDCSATDVCVVDLAEFPKALGLEFGPETSAFCAVG